MSNITTQTIRVDLSTDKVIPSAFTHQNDTARTLEFSMYNKGVPYTMTGNTVKFAYKSPIVDGAYTVITGSGMESGTVSGNKVTVALPVAYTRISGVGLLTMIITPSSGTIRPVNIRLVVQKSADGSDVMAGASDFPDAWMDEKVYSWLDDHIDGIFTEEQFTDAVDNWLDDHPEATTTVEDGSITVGKLQSNTAKKVVNNTYNFKRIAREIRLRDGSEPANLHGGCAVSSTEIVYALLHPDYLTSNKADIVVYNDSTHTFTKKGEVAIGHCDSMAYDPASGYLYIAPAYLTSNGSEVRTGNIYVYNYSNLNLVDTLSDLNAHSVCVDKSTGEMYYTTFDNKWCKSDGTVLFTFSASNDVSRQAIMANNGDYYLITAFPNNIRKLGSDGSVVANIPFAEAYDFYYVGEVEWADILPDGTVFVGSKMTCDNKTEVYNQIWKSNFAVNEAPTLYHDYALITTAHVDASSTAHNPDGRTGNRFKTINEAMLYATCRQSIEEMDLYDGTYTGRFNKSVAIVGNDNTVLASPQFKSGVFSIVGVDSITGTAEIGASATVKTKTLFSAFAGETPLDLSTYTWASAGTTGWTVVTAQIVIRSNVVFVKFEASFSGAGASGYQNVVTGLPKPDRNWFFEFTDNSGNPVKVRVNTSGVVAVNNIGANNALGIDTTLIYPICGK